ncbi:MAG TPA: signal peptidase II [Solirubrobacteraceae bacterium]|nr:signal peptidase II [Solirubrobacteraceae bacterium]
MSRARGAWARTGITLGVVVLVDQVTKKLVRDGITPGDEDPILPALKLVHVKNEGVAFGIEAGGKTIVIALIALALLALVLYFARHTARPLIWLPTGLLMGGALGNIVDRIRDGAVTDFLKIPAWPAFNVADVAITAGVLALVLVLERREGSDEGPAGA